MRVNETFSSQQKGVASTIIQRVEAERSHAQSDVLAVEEPLEIRLGFGPVHQRTTKSISITMRTPGHDFDLAAGFLFTEGMIREASDIEEIAFCGPAVKSGEATNVVRVELKPSVEVDLARLERHFYTSSSCGVCGKSSIEALRIQSRFTDSGSGPYFQASVIHRLPDRLREAQGIFDSTGGLHASALFSTEGKLEIIREDVGRHNALDKLIGHALVKAQVPLREQLLMVSGRASFELIQKASMAGISVFAAVGAPSSLALELAQDVGMTLLGFVRNQRFNIYHGESRILFAGNLSAGKANA